METRTKRHVFVILSAALLTIAAVRPATAAPVLIGQLYYVDNNDLGVGPDPTLDFPTFYLSNNGLSSLSFSLALDTLTGPVDLATNGSVDPAASLFTVVAPDPLTFADIQTVTLHIMSAAIGGVPLDTAVISFLLNGDPSLPVVGALSVVPLQLFATSETLSIYADQKAPPTTPVPEPSTLILSTIGAGVLFGRRSKRC